MWNYAKGILWKIEKYVIKEGVFNWLLKTLLGNDNAAKLRYYAKIKTDPKLYKMSKTLEKRFKELDKAKDAQEIVESINIELDAMIEARSLSIAQLETLTRVLFSKDPSRISTDEMKRDILVYAKREPEEFMSIVNDPVLKLQATVHKCFEEGLIKYRNKNKEVWFNTKTNKTRLCTIPFGEDPIYIVSSYFQSDDGIEALKHLEQLLD